MTTSAEAEPRGIEANRSSLLTEHCQLRIAELPPSEPLIEGSVQSELKAGPHTNAVCSSSSSSNKQSITLSVCRPRAVMPPLQSNSGLWAIILEHGSVDSLSRRSSRSRTEGRAAHNCSIRIQQLSSKQSSVQCAVHYYYAQNAQCCAAAVAVEALG